MGNDVLADRQIAFVDRRNEGQGVQVLEIRPIRVVLDLVALAVADPQDLLPGAALGNLGDGIVELPAGHEIHLGADGQLLRALREREQLHSTGIGDGIALPHARNALVGLVDHPILVFGRHAQGIPYGAIDAIPARLFFLLVAPTVTQHLSILARLSRVLRDPKLRQGLQTAERPEKVLQLLRGAETPV